MTMSASVSGQLSVLPPAHLPTQFFVLLDLRGAEVRHQQIHDLNNGLAALSTPGEEAFLCGPVPIPEPHLRAAAGVSGCEPSRRIVQSSS